MGLSPGFNAESAGLRTADDDGRCQFVYEGEPGELLRDELPASAVPDDAAEHDENASIFRLVDKSDQGAGFELDPSTTTRSALGSHAGASRFAYNWGLALVKDRLDARQALEVLAMRQGAGAGEARAWAAETAGPVPWTLYSCCVAGAVRVTRHAPVVQVSPSRL